MTDTTSTGFSAEELELFGYLLEDEGLDTSVQRMIQPRAPDAEVPLTFAQERLWFLDQWDPGNPASNIPFAVRLTGRLSVVALERSLNEIVRRHEALRTTFPAEDGQPQHQVIAPVLTIPLTQVDLRHVPADEQEAEVRRLMLLNAQHRFNLALGPLLRADLLCLAEQSHVFLLNIHHIVFDAWSVGLFLGELTILYNAFSQNLPSPLPPLAVQYPDFAIWQRNWLQGEVLEQQLAYWKEQLSGSLPVLELPGDRPRPPMLTYEGAVCYHQFPPELSVKLAALSQNEGVTPFMTLFAAFQVLLYRYTNADDIITGSMIANRDFVDIENLLGFFANTLLLRTSMAGNPSFRAFLQRVREGALEAFAHQNVPFEQLIEALKPPRDTSHTPLFQTMFILQNAPVPSVSQNDLRVEFLRVDNGTSKYDFTLSLTEMPDGMRAAAEYRTDLFNAETIARLLRHYQVLLERIVTDADCGINHLPLLTEAERQQLHAWNGTAAPYPRDAGLHTLVAAQAARVPTAVALIDGLEQVRYAEFEQRANQLAHYLHGQGGGVGNLVGVCMARSATLVTTLLGILKAGAAYLPLDPRYPPERLALMLDDAGPILVLIDEIGATRLPAPASGDPLRINVGAETAAIAAQPTDAPSVHVGGGDLAYVIYTSGSTGRPKGVRATHRGAVNRSAWMEQAFPFHADEVCAQKTALSFVDSVWEIFGPLMAGCPLVMLPDEVVLDLERLLGVLAERRVSRLVLVPSLLRAILQLGGDLAARLPALKLWISSGEALSTELAAQFHSRLPGRTLLNLYGSSEVAADATWHVVTPDSLNQPIPLGRPIHNMQVFVLDNHMQPVPIGVPGEIYIGGDGLAQGYHQRPDLTAERFLNFGFAIADFGLDADQSKIQNLKSKIYKTGDLGRYRPDGALEFLGRSDQQVKLRGFRIELGEIETLLAQHPAVRAAVVVLREDATGDPQLVAYVVLQELRTQNPEPSHTAQEGSGFSVLGSFLRERLPDYMVPSAFVLLEQFPLTPSGKIDRKALPAPDHTRSARALVPPRTPVEKVLVGMWSQVLGREQIGVEDNFFEIGGHSLKATQLLNRVRETFHVNLPLRSLFQATTVATLGALVIAHEGQPGQSEKIAQMWLRLQRISPEERQRLLEQKRKERSVG
ncbi:MAG: amino acid adenylation domain-containing protein [Chloroflexaceae bacterium]|nr:amino acid adenylation domain-containing protein [Chloroflexaceae bacterium]